MVVWPGAIIMAVVLKGFVYAASISTTVNVWLAMAKKSSLLSAPLITLSRRSEGEWHKTNKEDVYEYDK